MKKRTIFDLFLIFILLIVLIFLGTRDYTQDKDKDSQRFDKEYSMVNKDNVFKYVNEEEVNDILEKGNGIIFMAFNKSEWSNYYAKMLNDVAKEQNIKEIYYYNFQVDREKQSIEYRKIVDYLRVHLKKNDMGQIDIYAPCLVVMKNNDVLAFDDETSFMNSDIKPKDYWTEENMQIKREQFRIIFDSYQGGNNNGGEE